MNGEEAIALAEKELPDLAIVDIVLDGKMNGIEVAREIRKRTGIPFIYITGNTDDATRSDAMKTGPLDYLEKPVDIEKLISLLKNLHH
ncbi:MAG: hypothetical protein CVV44_07750 [Spirochaetae bacterium HGW-Spirochaetae-1]|jgi:two-component system sensor histidine kinase UhpB|nr:MAG: hypothetical protein CVV44_07750 [Spirochaetae bacterium HGW-Spirochaetae-1]